MEKNTKEIILGTSKIDPRFRVTLVQPVPKLLNVGIGDLIVFVQNEKGEIMIRSSSISKLKTP
ncbi:MAG: hypothetical protein PHU34_07470 [Candidatus Methanoperedens sp.]|nr:hypothetical protein [Candidatus Methanoperedens sp.]